MANTSHQHLKASGSRTNFPLTCDTDGVRTAPVFLRCARDKAAAGRCRDARAPSVSGGRGLKAPSHQHGTVFLTAGAASPPADCLRTDLGEKRKRAGESSLGLPKRTRRSTTAGGAAGSSHCRLSVEAIPVVKRFNGNKLSRSHRLHQEAVTDCVDECGAPGEGTVGRELNNRDIQDSDSVHKVSHWEDSLWTDRYGPQHTAEVIGNSSAVNKLHSWLKKWKVRADGEERRIVEERKREKSGHESWDCGDFQGEAGSEEDGEGPLFNTLLITGPVGVGKTASVYACARELGFKVFEVNCSSRRSGHHVVSQLKEATQSHLVETEGNKHPTLGYTSKSTSNSCTPKSLRGSGRLGRPKKVRSTSRKQSVRAPNRTGETPAASSLVHYFKAKAKADHFHFGSPESSSSAEHGPSCHSDVTASRTKRAATSLILFEEVDVIFDRDVGFLDAIKAFMATTKRPVVLTTNDPYFKQRFDGQLMEITFRSPPPGKVCRFLQRVLSSEGVRVDLEELSSLLTLTCGDVRRCLLQLQLWMHDCNPGLLRNSRLCTQDLNGADKKNSPAPQLVSGCSAAMLGLHPVTVQHLVNLLKCQLWSQRDTAELLRLLEQCWERRVPLLYSNLKLLLDAVTSTAQHRTPDLHQLGHPISPRMCSSSSARKVSRLSRRRYNASPSFNLIHKPSGITSATISAAAGGLCPKDKAEGNLVKVEKDCLEAMADFYELMSYLDAMQQCTPDGFLWTGAEVKDGMLDEMSEEEDGRSWSQGRLQLEIQAAIEAFGCHRCWWRVCEARMEAQNYRAALSDRSWRRQMERLGLRPPSQRQSLSFRVEPLCAPSVCNRRHSLTKELLSSQTFSPLGNRRAFCVDYMPILRFIRRSQTAPFQTHESCTPLKYLSSSQLGLSETVMEWLAEDFSLRSVWK